MWSPASLKGRFWILAWLLQHNVEFAMAAFKLKVKLVCATKGQNLGFGFGPT